MTLLANMIINQLKLNNNRRKRIVDKVRTVTIAAVDIEYKLNDE